MDHVTQVDVSDRSGILLLRTSIKIIPKCSWPIYFLPFGDWSRLRSIGLVFGLGDDWFLTVSDSWLHYKCDLDVFVSVGTIVVEPAHKRL